MFRIGIRFVLMFAVVLLLTSCASSKRMMRLSPFTSKNPKKVSYDESQVNLWPLFYNKGNFNSVLWPVIDSDSKGFAVRPLYNQDGNEYSVLFPFCAWNPVNRDGWVFNTYWDKKHIGSFPLFHLGNKKKFNYILPVWWDNDWESFGTIGASFSDDINFVGPLWFEKSTSTGGLFPLLTHGPKWGWLFPLYNYEKNENDFYLNFLGGTLGRFSYDYDDCHYRLLTGFYQQENDNNYQGLIPLYYYEEEENQKLLVTPIGGRGWNAKTGENSLVNILGPLYIKTQNKKQKTQFEAFCWPLYINSQKPDEKNIGSVPLFWYNKNKGDGNGFLNVLGIVYHSSYNKTGSFKSILWPLSFNTINKKHETSFGSFPLFIYNRGEDSGGLNILGPLYHHSYNNKKTESFYSVMWPLSFYSKDTKETTYGSFPLFWYNKSKESGLFNILGLLWDYRWNRKGWEASSLLMLGGVEHRRYDENSLPGTPRFRRRIRIKTRMPNKRKRVLKEEHSYNFLLFGESNKKKYIVWKDEFDQEKLYEVSNALQNLKWLNKDVKKYQKRFEEEKKYINRAQKKLQKETKKRQEKIQKLTVLFKELNIPVLDLTDNSEIEKIKVMIFEKYCTIAKSKRISIPFLYTYNKFRGKSKWNVLWFLANGKKQKNYEKISILRYLYRYEKSGDVSSRIIFPFMTYKTAPKKSKFSFLWRVFSYKREDNNTSGHIFFIPF